jgi:hypothetical protein
MKPRIFVLPGLSLSRAWYFADGVSVADPSLSDALRTAEHLLDAHR